eukprot:COSAG03_NODE_5885_length_1156_cov_0.924314_2_plen_33_part_01
MFHCMVPACATIACLSHADGGTALESWMSLDLL